MRVRKTMSIILAASIALSGFSPININYAKAANDVVDIATWTENEDARTYRKGVSYGFYNNEENTHKWISNNAGISTQKSTDEFTIWLPFEANVSIPWSISSEKRFDVFTIELDEHVVVDKVSGMNDGVIEKTLAAGKHTIHVKYKKDVIGDENDDEASITLNDVITNYESHEHTYVTNGSCHKCTICGGIWEHDFKLDHKDELSCTQDQTAYYKCVCGDGYQTVEKQKMEHNYTETVIKEPTCTEKGKAKYVCNNCGDTEEKDIDPTGHTWKCTGYDMDPEISTRGVSHYTCDNCGQRKDEEFNENSIFVYSLNQDEESYSIRLYNDDDTLTNLFKNIGLYDNIIIPDTYKEKPITKISSGFFRSDKTIQPKKIVFGKYIRTIESNWCDNDNLYNIEELVLDDNLETIPNDAFGHLAKNVEEDKWPDVTMPKSLTNIGNNAFGYSHINHLKFNNTKTSFMQFTKAIIKDVDLTNVVKVNSFTFDESILLNGIDIKPSVEFIGSHCFDMAIVPHFEISEKGNPVYFQSYSLDIYDTKRGTHPNNWVYDGYDTSKLGTCWDQDEIIFPERSVIMNYASRGANANVTATIKVLGHVGEGDYENAEECAKHVTDKMSEQFWFKTSQDIIIGDNIKTYSRETIAHFNPQKSITFGKKINVAASMGGAWGTETGYISDGCTITYTTKKPFFMMYQSLNHGKVRLPNTKVKGIGMLGFTTQAYFDEPVDLSECEYFGFNACLYNSGGKKYPSEYLDLSAAVHIENSAFSNTGLHAKEVIFGKNLRTMDMGAFYTWAIDKMVIPEKTLNVSNNGGPSYVQTLICHSSPTIRSGEEYDITDCYSDEFQDAHANVKGIGSLNCYIDEPTIKSETVYAYIKTSKYWIATINTLMNLDISGIPYPYINTNSNDYLSSVKFNNMVDGEKLESNYINNKPNLESVELDPNTKVLSSYCLSNDPKLHHINLEDTNLERIEDGAFYGSFCSGMEKISISFPDTLKEIGSIFSGSTDIEELHTNRIKSIKGGRLNTELPSLKKLYLDDSLKSLDGWDSSGNPINLDYLYVGNNVEVKTSPFCAMHQVKEIEFGNDVTEIQDNFAQYDGALKKVTLPASLEAIGTFAFQSCSSLSDMKLPDTLQSIGDHAFENSGLTTVDLPASLQFIGDYAFLNSKIKDLVFKDADENDGQYHNIEIGDHAFYGLTQLETLYLSNNIYSIPADTFTGCESLKTVWMGNKLMDMKDQLLGSMRLEKVYCYHWSNYNKEKLMTMKENHELFVSAPDTTQFIELYDIDYHYDGKIKKYRAEYEEDETLFKPEEKHGVFSVIGWGMSENGLMKYPVDSVVRNLTDDYQNGIALYAKYGAYIPFEITGDDYESANVTMSTKETGGNILIRDYDITDKKEIPIFETVNRVLYATFTIDGISTIQKIDLSDKNMEALLKDGIAYEYKKENINDDNVITDDTNVTTGGAISTIKNPSISITMKSALAESLSDDNVQLSMQKQTTSNDIAVYSADQNRPVYNTDKTIRWNKTKGNVKYVISKKENGKWKTFRTQKINKCKIDISIKKLRIKVMKKKHGKWKKVKNFIIKV